MTQERQILESAPHMGGVEAIVWLLHCPVCGDDCVEQMGPGGGDHTAVTVHPDRDSYDSPIGTRGGYVAVQLFCPAGHGFDLIIANHKGQEYIGVKLAGPRDYASSAGLPEEMTR